jgi:DNA repair exonuclease SbcCD ATPase subunit
MIKVLQLINYQSHKRTRLRLSPGINGIIGKSNAGKTAIIRALNLLRSNRPGGFAYHYNHAKRAFTQILAKVDNHTIKFHRTKTATTYQIDKEKPYEGFGRDVPDKIVDILNLDDINFSEQLGLPFLITASPGEVAKTINRITKADDFEKCMSIANKEINAQNAKRKTLVKDISDIELKLKRFKPLAEAKQFIARANRIENIIESLTGKRDGLTDLIQFIKDARQAIKDESKLLKPKQLIDKAEILQEEIKNANTTHALIDQILSLKDQIKLAKKEKRFLIRDYVAELRHEKKCPTCYHEITYKQLGVIRRELK